MSSAQYPKFISTLPIGEDKFRSNVHNKIAGSVSQIIKDGNYGVKKQIIGLEGDWGSGKSNIIKILKSKRDFLNSRKYLHFVYDSWTHQEDLNRRALLEELIEFLANSHITSDKQIWHKKKRELDEKTIVSVKSTFPEVKLFWILLITSFLSYQFLNSLFKVVEHADIIASFFFGNWKPFIFIWALPMILFGLGLCYLQSDIRKEIKKNRDLSDNEKLSSSQLLGKIFYLLNGKEIESKTTDRIIENEPSNKQFKTFLNEINAALVQSQKILVLTIDNIDRLPNDKVRALWSTINIFFAEDSEVKPYDNIWLIIPYDESKIIESFGENILIGKGLIEKTFSVKFKIPPPIYSNWDGLLEAYLKQAFGKTILSQTKSEIFYLKKIFDSYCHKKIIRPREIVNYVNEVVTLYLQFPSIPLRYLALYSMTCDAIEEDPVETILLRSYINDNSRFLFRGDELLDKYISSLVFGVSLDDAEEVLFVPKITDLLKEGIVRDIDKYSNNSSFTLFFQRIYNQLQFDTIPEKSLEAIPDILNKLEENRLVTKDIALRYWTHLAVQMNGITYCNQGLTPLHEKIFAKDYNLGVRVLNRCANEMASKAVDQKTTETYIRGLHAIEEFLKKNNKSLRDLNLERKNVEAYNYFVLLYIAPGSFKQYKLDCSETEIEEYFFAGDDLDLNSLEAELDSLAILRAQAKFTFTRVFLALKDGVKKLQESEIENLPLYFKCLSTLTDETPLTDVSLDKKVVNDALERLSDEESEVIAACIGFALVKDRTSLISDFPGIVRALSTKRSVHAILTYTNRLATFQSLLELAVKNPEYQLVKDLIKEVVSRNSADRLNALWALSNFDEISKSIFSSNYHSTAKFFKMLSGWSSYVERDLGVQGNIEKISLGLFDYALKINTKISAIVLSASLKYLSSKTPTDITKFFDNADAKEFSHAVLNKFMVTPNPATNIFCDHVLDSLVIYLVEFAQGSRSTTDKNFSRLINYLSHSPKKLRDLFSKVEKTLSDQETIRHKQLSLFLNGLIDQGLFGKNADKTVKNILPPLLNDNDFYSKHFKKYYPLYISTIARSKKFKQYGLALIRERLKHFPSSNPIRKLADEKLPGWNVVSRE